jgi:hypothetical protein
MRNVRRMGRRGEEQSYLKRQPLHISTVESVSSAMVGTTGREDGSDTRLLYLAMVSRN